MSEFLDKDGLSYFWGKITDKLDDKQDTLTSGTNIKTINGKSILGSGDLDVVPSFSIDSRGHLIVTYNN